MGGQGAKRTSPMTVVTPSWESPDKAMSCQREKENEARDTHTTTTHTNNTAVAIHAQHACARTHVVANLVRARLGHVVLLAPPEVVKVHKHRGV